MTCSKRVEPGVVAHFSNLTHLPRFWPNSFSLATMCPNIWPLLKKCFIAILRADWFIILCVSEKSLAIRRLILEAANRGGRLDRTSHSVNIAQLTLTKICCWKGCWWYFPHDDKAEKVYGHFWSKLDVCQYRVTRLADRLKACQLHQSPVNLFWHFLVC